MTLVVISSPRGTNHGGFRQREQSLDTMWASLIIALGVTLIRAFLGINGVWDTLGEVPNESVTPVADGIGVMRAGDEQATYPPVVFVLCRWILIPTKSKTNRHGAPSPAQGVSGSVTRTRAEGAALSH